MSVILTERGWVELGATEPLMQAYETVGCRAERCEPQPAPVVNKVRCPMLVERVMVCEFCERPFDAASTHLNCLHPTVLTV